MEVGVTIFTLRNIVNIEVLQEIQERFSDATGFAVIIADEQGVPVTKPSNFTDFCTSIRSSKQGSGCCILSDRKVGLLAAEHKKPIVHYCHSGLIDVAAPIVVEGRHLGSVLCGQVLMEGHDEKRTEQIREKSKHLAIDQKLLQLFFEKIQFTNRKRVDDAAQMLQLVANYIVKIGATFLAQEELNEKNRKLVAELEKRVELEKLLQETQFKVLQSQINPHFLFNTLNTISRLAYLENAEQTQNVTYSLAKIMRYSLRNVDQMVTLKEELNYIENYLLIQQNRFRKKIQFNQQIEVDTEAVKIPIFSLQPIIENAIIHGFEPQDSKVDIKVHGYLKANKVILEVSDTGVGITKEKLSCLFSPTTKHSDTTGIGMNNVQKRLRHYFGEEYGITAIKSKIGAGTLVQITIPVPGGALK
jgi:two-component system, LytTR family, sensor kinase